MKVLFDTDIVLDLLLVIVNRNLGDYKNSPLPVYSPSDFLALLAATEE